MSNMLKLATAIKIRNKEIAYDTYRGMVKQASTSSLLAKINPTSFRNTVLPEMQGLGITGSAIALSNYLRPEFGVLSKAVSGNTPVTTFDNPLIRKAMRSKIMQESYSNLGGRLSKAFMAPGREAARQDLIFNALRNNQLTPQQLADNVTRYVPVEQHRNLYNTYKNQLGYFNARKYKDAFIL